jgi:hypothetical protein
VLGLGFGGCVQVLYPALEALLADTAWSEWEEALGRLRLPPPEEVAEWLALHETHSAARAELAAEKQRQRSERQVLEAALSDGAAGVASDHQTSLN